jgi:hypothetical protein
MNGPNDPIYDPELDADLEEETCGFGGHELGDCDCYEDATADEPYEMTDVEADADTLASAGYGTDEDYGDYGQYDDWESGGDW